MRSGAVKALRDKSESLSVMRCGSVCIVIFFCAHLAFLVGLSTPEKYVFDEVHYVPAARQMLEQAPVEPMLNPMHPPLAKQIIALSIYYLGDNAFGWRYPATVFGALSLGAGAVCPAIGGDRSKPHRLLQPDAVCAGAHRDAGYIRARFCAVRHRSLPARLPQDVSAPSVCSRRNLLRLFGVLQMEWAVSIRGCDSDRRPDQANAALADAIRR